MIGDPYQLPPIQWNSVFDSLIKSGSIVHAKLEKVHRTAELETNGIYSNSMKIRAYFSGCNNILDFVDREPLAITRSDNFQMILGDIKTMSQIVDALVNGGKTVDSMVIICPYNKYLTELNEILGKHVNSNTATVTDTIKHKTWKVGDRVMMNKNNYDIGIFNGEEGIVTAVGTDNITVKFDKYIGQTNGQPNMPTQKSFEFKLSEESDGPELEEDFFVGELSVKYLDHSFAISVHRSQGSEYNIVLLYVPTDIFAGNFFERKLAYTAITRAKKGIFVIGNISAFLAACATDSPSVNESLSERLRSHV